jgi:hypothetical protein
MPLLLEVVMSSAIVLTYDYFGAAVRCCACDRLAFAQADDFYAEMVDCH